MSATDRFMPREKGAAPLDVVIAVMAFLAALALGASLIADEPTGNVDPEIGARLIRLFAELNRLGTTVLIATHDRTLVEEVRAREMRLVDGRLVELRSPRP